MERTFVINFIAQPFAGNPRLDWLIAFGFAFAFPTQTVHVLRGNGDPAPGTARSKAPREDA